jgi:flagellar biogenesis protein FliO
MKSLRWVLLKELVLFLGAVVALVVISAWVGMTRLARAQARARSATALRQVDLSLEQRLGEFERVAHGIGGL